jgi:hypothetical protein
MARLVVRCWCSLVLAGAGAGAGAGPTGRPRRRVHGPRPVKRQASSVKRLAVPAASRSPSRSQLAPQVPSQPSLVSSLSRLSSLVLSRLALRLLPFPLPPLRLPAARLPTLRIVPASCASLLPLSLCCRCSSPSAETARRPVCIAPDRPPLRLTCRRPPRLDCFSSPPPRPHPHDSAQHV